MNPEMVMSYELSNQRIGVWKTTEGEWLVSNTATGKSILCVSCSQALDIFDRCIEAFRGTNLMN
jgi:hypothetical protein